jgi:hypothetical protein
MSDQAKLSVEAQERRRTACRQAPEWAEHARSEDREYDICDDGRGAVACGRRHDDKPCPI